jgi:predicted  nucleic acid-binding Zn-ribbon protein
MDALEKEVLDAQERVARLEDQLALRAARIAQLEAQRVEVERATAFLVERVQFERNSHRELLQEYAQWTTPRRR